MKITVYTLVHSEAGIVAQVVNVDDLNMDVDKALIEQIGFDFTSDADYEVITITHEKGLG